MGGGRAFDYSKQPELIGNPPNAIVCQNCSIDNRRAFTGTRRGLIIHPNAKVGGGGVGRSTSILFSYDFVCFCQLIGGGAPRARHPVPVLVYKRIL